MDNTFMFMVDNQIKYPNITKGRPSSIIMLLIYMAKGVIRFSKSMH
jgi:hypothetical protein